MSSPFYLIIRGEFVIVGKEPDGDSVRFIADHSDFFQDLHRAHRIRLSSDGSVQLRFEGIDAPEVHYGTAAQPLGTDVRDQLLAIMGFRNVRFESQRPNRVEHAQPDHIMGAILTQAAEANGRPVSYLLLDAAARTIPEDEDWVRVDEALLRQTLNHQLLDRGLAYYTVYTST
ncbi:MAG: thermonuclease family protein, partial [Chloroflexota bacterium]